MVSKEVEENARLLDESVPEWLNKKVFGKVVNLEHPGSEVYAALNGYAFRIKDGAEVTIPEAVANILNNAIAIEHHISGGEEHTTERRRYLFQPIQAKPEENELVKEVQESKVQAREKKVK